VDLEGKNMERLPMAKKKKVPKITINRLSLYYRQLEMLEAEGKNIISSDRLASMTQINPAQVRKDLGYFGEFGIRGVGYEIGPLKEQLKSILCVNRIWRMSLVGVGNLGSALLRHQGFYIRGFHFVVAFDSDPEKIGIEIVPGVRIYHVDRINEEIKKFDVQIGVIATPADVSQYVADLLIEADVNAILNFSPVHIQVPDCCLVENVDFTVKLDILTYKVSRQIYGKRER